MSWPWSELGLDGPATLDEVRHAYAERTKQTHPEEDPEGFQRLHEAYQLARKQATDRKTSPKMPKAFQENQDLQPHAEKKKEQDPSIWKELDKTEDTKNPPQQTETPEQDEKVSIWEELDEMEPAQKPQQKETSEQKDTWDYERIFEEAEKEKQAQFRKELQKRSGLTDETDNWENVALALQMIKSIRKNGMPDLEWNRFLHSPLFEQVCRNKGFILVLEDWLRETPLTPPAAQEALLKRLNLSPGHVPSMYYALYLLLTESGAAFQYKEVHKQVKRPPNKNVKQALIPVVGVFLSFLVFCFVEYQVIPAFQTRHQYDRLSRWLSEDLGMTVTPHDAVNAQSQPEKLRFEVPSMPDFWFTAEYTGKRDLEKDEPGYKTNFSNAVFDWNLQQFAKNQGYELNEAGGKSWRSLTPDSTATYYLEFPLTEAEKCVQSLDAFYKELEQNDWYQDFPPKYKLCFVRSGVVYYTHTAPNAVLNVPEIVQYCQKLAPEGICGFILRETGLDQCDFSAEEYTLYQVEPMIPFDSPEFYFTFAAIDTKSKEILRLYAYSETENEIISFPAEQFEAGRTFAELKEKSVPFHGAKQVNAGFPNLYRM